jgi:hypothetical protein
MTIISAARFQHTIWAAATVIRNRLRNGDETGG